MALQLKVTIDGIDLTRTTLNKIARNGPKAVNRASSKMATFAARQARKNLRGPYSKKRTQVRKMGAKGNYVVQATHPQGDAAVASIEYGAKPHVIPNNPIWGTRHTTSGKTFVRVHPGMQGKHFMGNAFDETVRKANRIIGQALREFDL